MNFVLPLALQDLPYSLAINYSTKNLPSHRGCWCTDEYYSLISFLLPFQVVNYNAHLIFPIRVKSKILKEYNFIQKKWTENRMKDNK